MCGRLLSSNNVETRARPTAFGIVGSIGDSPKKLAEAEIGVRRLEMRFWGDKVRVVGVDRVVSLEILHDITPAF